MEIKPVINRRPYQILDVYMYKPEENTFWEGFKMSPLAEAFLPLSAQLPTSEKVSKKIMGYHYTPAAASVPLQTTGDYYAQVLLNRDTRTSSSSERHNFTTMMVLLNNESLRSPLEHTARGTHRNKYNLKTPEIILGFGYLPETHFTTTEDGYILKLHRIRHGKNGSLDDGRVRVPIFLQHGLISSSSDWVITGEGRGLAFLLADQGYDVWMGNTRGNTYSKGHTNPNISNKDYWSFTYDEHGKYDLPAMINHVKKSTGQEKMFYVGHSMGTMMFWVANHYYGQDFANNFIAMFGLGPVSQLQNMVSPLRYLARYADRIAV
ncbi:unnamed protein product, partial [Cyprideis torosa]